VTTATRIVAYRFRELELSLLVSRAVENRFMTRMCFLCFHASERLKGLKSAQCLLSFSMRLVLSCSAVGCWLLLHVNCHSTRLIPLEIHSGWWKFIETTNERNEQPKGRRGLSKLSSCDSVDLDSSSQNVASSNTKAQAL
jgi:hypothetical protein